MVTEQPAQPTPKPGVLPLVLGWLGVAGHLVAGFFYLVSGLAVPGWAVLVLLLIWAAVSVAIFRLMRTRPAWVLAVPVAEFAFWYLVLLAGDRFLGWTA